METVSVNVRFPADLHIRLKERAEADRRSLNNEILHLVDEALNAKEKAP